MRCQEKGFMVPAGQKLEQGDRHRGGARNTHHETKVA